MNLSADLPFAFQFSFVAACNEIGSKWTLHLLNHAEMQSEKRGVQSSGVKSELNVVNSACQRETSRKKSCTQGEQ